jgi:hypothetical protein
VCFDADSKRLFCTRHVVFDETFMPARAFDQSILGHYDPTPRNRIPTLLHGSLEKAMAAGDDINSLPFMPMAEMIDNLANFSDEDMKEKPYGRLEHPEADEQLVHTHEEATWNDLFGSMQPSFQDEDPASSSSARASGCHSAAPSGGDSTAPSGGKSTASTGGQPEEYLSGGGANSGVPKSMLSAGEDLHSAPSHSARFSSTNLRAFPQRDFRGSIVYNSNKPGTWLTLGPLKLSECNDGDLAEWMIGGQIGCSFKKRFCTGRDELKRDMKGSIYDTLEHQNGMKPPEVKILLQDPDRDNNRKIKFYQTEIFISMDPTVDGSKAIHRNCLREALKDTYEGAHTNPNYTLQNLLDDAIKLGHCSSTQGTVEQVTIESDDEDNEYLDDNDDDDDKNKESAPPPLVKPPPKPPDINTAQAAPMSQDTPSAAPAAQGKKHKTKTGKTNKRTAAAAATSQEEPPAKRTREARSSTRTAHFAAMAVRRIVTETQKCFGIETNATRFDKMKRAKREFRMRNDTEGASFAALYATITVCAMASSLGYDSVFLPLEPKNQKDARKRPDADLWKAAEEKELSTLWSKSAFQLVDRPSAYLYDPLPLQFIYKQKVKDGDYDHGVPKARLVAMGNLQYDHEYGDTYAPTARLYTVRTMAAIAAQEGLTMKKFDLTGAFLIADMDTPMYVQVPGYDLPSDKALMLKKALYGTKSRKS